MFVCELPWVFSTGRSLLSAAGTHELEEKVQESLLKRLVCACGLRGATALEQLSVQLARLHEGARR
jgi:hypothetical protein